MSKKEMRDYLNSVKEFLNLSALARKFGVPRQSINMFLRGYDGGLRFDTVKAIVSFVQDL